MTGLRWVQRLLVIAAVGGSLTMTGCSHLTNWIVATRDDQGARSLESQRFRDAVHVFRLALDIDPDDQKAREGYVEAQADLAETFYQNSQFTEALAALEEARKVDSTNVRVAGLFADVSNSRLKSEIVHSNYEGYKESIENLEHGYASLKAPEVEVTYRLKRFGYTYDTADLNRAIRASNDIALEVSKLTTHLTQLRTQVSTGSLLPESGNSPASSSAGSLLPIP